MPQQPPDSFELGQIGITLYKRCEQILKDEFIDEHQDLQKLIKKNQKGYVPFSYFLADTQIQTILQPCGLSPTQQLNYLRRATKQREKNIRVNNWGIRRERPYQHYHQIMKFFYVDNFKADLKPLELVELLGLEHKPRKIEMGRAHVSYARIYYPYYREIEQKMESWKNMKLGAQNYSDYLINRDLFNSAIIWEINPMNANRSHYWKQYMQDAMEEPDEEEEEQNIPEDEGEMLFGEEDRAMEQEQMERYQRMRYLRENNHRPPEALPTILQQNNDCLFE